MNKLWTDDAWNDYIYWSMQDKKTLKRINQLLKDIDRNQYDGIGKAERNQSFSLFILLFLLTGIFTTDTQFLPVGHVRVANELHSPNQIAYLIFLLP